MEQIKIVVCNNQQNSIDYFQSLTQSYPEINVVGVANNYEETADIIGKESPDIVLIDIRLEEDGGGIKTVEQISKRFPHVKSIVTGIGENDELIIDAYMGGEIQMIRI